MEHTYKISGMTCNGCHSDVEKALNEVDGVTSASVNLEKSDEQIEIKKHIPLGGFQKVLKEAGGNYHIHLPGNKDEISKVSNLKPLFSTTQKTCFLIAFFLLSASLFAQEKKTSMNITKFKSKRNLRK